MMDWLNDAIVDYIKNNPDKRLSRPDIVSYFKLRVDITITAIDKLVQEKRITRINTALDGWNGNHFYELS